MKATVIAGSATLLVAVLSLEPGTPPKGAKVVLAVHGGAGVKPGKEMTPALEKMYRADLKRALREGYRALKRKGGTSLDAVEAAIRVLEDSPRFNAARGAVFTHDGRNELDASIMEGKDRRAGAVASVSCLKNPISAARAVLEKSEHVLLTGRGAELFATQQGLEVVEPSYFWTKERWLELKKAREQEEKKGKTPAAPDKSTPERGTVGAVALDAAGNLAAGTSTGGMTNKRYGRVGDSPIIGAGTYADNAACAVSATGHGEIFIRYAVAHDLVALMKYKGLSVREAAQRVIDNLPKEPDGVGGVIALDAKGALAVALDTEGMYRGWVTSDGEEHVAIYKE
jgi:beta-aspartyl-peptidase (threonine type)